jgi:transposase
MPSPTIRKTHQYPQNINTRVTTQLIFPIRQYDPDSFWEGVGVVRRNLFWLSDKQWGRIAPHLPTDVRGVARVDDRRVISGIVHVLKTGCRWCDCPPEYGPHMTIYNRFVRWARRGVWENLFRELAGNGRSTDTQMIDSTHVKAHRSAAGGKRGSRSRLLAVRAEGAIRRFTHSQMLRDA